MTPDEAREFLRDNHRAVLATFRSDGRPQLSPVLAVVDGEGRVMVSTREPAIKTKNVRRDPRVSMCLLSNQFHGAWGQVEGEAEVVSLPEAMDLLVDYYRRAAGEHQDWEEYRADMTKQRRVILRFAVDRAGPTVEG